MLAERGKGMKAKIKRDAGEETRGRETNKEREDSGIRQRVRRERGGESSQFSGAPGPPQTRHGRPRGMSD
eukprot:845808-Rhodomonas_salina.1